MTHDLRLMTGAREQHHRANHHQRKMLWYGLTMLEEEIAGALREAWAIYSSTYAHETAYAFGLFVVAENGLIIGSCYATEEATARRAAEYEWMIKGTPEERARIIRWWDADWPYSNDTASLFDRANELLRDAKDPAEVYIEATGSLPVGSPNSRIVRGVFGVNRDLVTRSIARLNPAAIAGRYTAECAEGDRAYALLQR